MNNVILLNSSDFLSEGITINIEFVIMLIPRGGGGWSVITPFVMFQTCLNVSRKLKTNFLFIPYSIYNKYSYLFYPLDLNFTSHLLKLVGKVSTLLKVSLNGSNSVS